MLQAGVAWLVLQAFPQAPQLLSAVFRLVSQPLETSPSQFPLGLMHAMLHTLFEQVGVPPEALQAVPQVPQFDAVILRSVSQPLVITPSQLP